MHETSLKFRQFELRVATYELRCAGEPVKLERIPMDLLILLVEKRGELLTREAIIERLWGKEFFLDTEHSINTAINKLRSVLRDPARSPMFIQTIVGKGYRFIAQVETVPVAGDIAVITVPLPSDLAQDAFAATGNPKDGSILPETLPVLTPSISPMGSSSLRWWLSWGLFAAVTILLVLAGHRWRQGPGSAAGNMYRSVAVLPFLNLSGQPEQQYVVEALSDQLRTLLAQGTRLRVLSRTSTIQYGGAKQTLPQFASALNVDAVLEGSMMRAGRTVRITARFVDARRDEHLWAQTYIENSDNLLADQDKIAADIVWQVGKRLGNEALELKEQSMNSPAPTPYIRLEPFLATKH
jgi:TolB-like protein/DNA-binding winged helix-turn-helix (wHTH) protein